MKNDSIEEEKTTKRIRQQPFYFSKYTSHFVFTMGAGGSSPYTGSTDFNGLMTLNIDTTTLPGGSNYTPEIAAQYDKTLSDIIEQQKNYVPPPPPPPVTDPAELARIFYETNLAYKGTSQYTETIFDKLKASASGITPYSMIRENRNVETYVTFYEGPTKYYTGSENIDELKAVGYTIQRDPVTHEWNALLYQDQIKNDLPPTQYIPGDAVDWTPDMGRDPTTGIPKEVTVPIPPPVVPHFPTQKDVTPTAPDYTPLYVLGGAIALYVIAKK